MEKILRYLNNFFYDYGIMGNIKIEDNKIKLSNKIIKGQYIKLQGSVMNDNVYEVIEVDNDIITITGAINEEFKGIVYLLKIPQNIRELETKIKEFEANNKSNAYISESFGNYSYSKATVNGKIATWQDVFSNELKPYRQIYDNIKQIKLYNLEQSENLILTSDNNHILYV